MPIYMEFQGIKGNVTAAGHEKWIDVGSVQFGVGRGVSTPVGKAADREASAPSVSEVVITKVLDDASCFLFQEALQGKGDKVVKFDFVKSGTGDKLETYLKFQLDDVMVSGYSISSGGDRPTESISLNFTKITYTNTPADRKTAAAGPQTYAYDLAKGAKA